MFVLCFRDLYILALSEMQEMDEDDELSYFSLAGEFENFLPTRRVMEKEDKLFCAGMGGRAVMIVKLTCVSCLVGKRYPWTSAQTVEWS